MINGLSEKEIMVVLGKPYKKRDNWLLMCGALKTDSNIKSTFLSTNCGYVRKYESAQTTDKSL